MINNKIRLTETEVYSIINNFKNTFKLTDQLWIFGSRVDMSAKGGDIDLYVETDESNSAAIIERKLSFLASLKLEIGDQKIDLVINHGKSDLEIYNIAKSKSVKLV